MLTLIQGALVWKDQLFQKQILLYDALSYIFFFFKLAMGHNLYEIFFGIL